MEKRFTLNKDFLAPEFRAGDVITVETDTEIKAGDWCLNYATPEIVQAGRGIEAGGRDVKIVQHERSY